MLIFKRVSVWFWDQGLRCFPKLFFVNGSQNEVVYAYVKLVIGSGMGEGQKTRHRSLGLEGKEVRCLIKSFLSMYF